MKKRGVSVVAAAYDLKAAFDLAAAFMRGGLTAQVCRTGTCPAQICADAVVLDPETFFCDAQREYEIMRALFESAGVGTRLFLKTDSSLRGNVAAEVSALLDAAGVEGLPFVPAMPKAGKITRDGVQWLHGENGESAVLADVRALIAGFRGDSAYCGPMDAMPRQGICVLDCQSQEEVDAIAEALGRDWMALAGTGALAERVACWLSGLPVRAQETWPLTLDGKRGLLDAATLEWREA